MDVDTREGELRSPLASLSFSFVGLPSFTTPLAYLISHIHVFVGDGREGTTPMDVDTHAATEGELRPPTPFCT
jgi:hypothetical protein